MQRALHRLPVMHFGGANFKSAFEAGLAEVQVAFERLDADPPPVGIVAA